MCGICGVYNFHTNSAIDTDLIKRMCKVMTHRGPDDEGVFAHSNIALGHTRLSIIDLASGHQPMHNEDGTIWIVFNGEIYNYLELRDFLIKRGHQYRSCSDTEAILHLYEEFDDLCVEKLRGMFAFAIWDIPNKKLFLARDRIGIKVIFLGDGGKLCIRNWPLV